MTRSPTAPPEMLVAATDPQTYEQRNVVERCFNRLNQFRDLATRYANRAVYYYAELTIAAIIRWLR